MNLTARVKVAKKRLHNVITGHWYVLYLSGANYPLTQHCRLMTKREAFEYAKWWTDRAGTIGGDAQVKNIYTNEFFSFLPARTE